MASGDAIDATKAAPFPHPRCQRNRSSSSGGGSNRPAPAEIQSSGARISHEKPTQIVIKVDLGDSDSFLDYSTDLQDRFSGKLRRVRGLDDIVIMYKHT